MFLMRKRIRKLPPHHFIRRARIGLDDLYHLGGYRFPPRNPAQGCRDLHSGSWSLPYPRPVRDSFHRSPARYKRTPCPGTSRALCGGADAHRRERMAHGGKERGFLRQRPRVGNHTESVHRVNSYNHESPGAHGGSPEDPGQSRTPPGAF